MKRILIAAILLVFIGCAHVEQSISPIRKKFATYVWWKDDIVWVRYDDMETINDSLILLRQRQADTILQALKKSK